MRIAHCVAVIAVLLTMVACTTRDGDHDHPAAARYVQPGRITNFDGQVLHIELTREDGSTEGFNSVRDEWFSWPYVPAIPGHAGRRWTLSKSKDDSTALAYALISWNNSDPTDYLAAGWWLEFPGPYRRRLPLEEAVGSAFYDGPEFDPNRPPRIPDMGEATYTGGTGGLYRYEYGSDWTGYPEPVSVEEFTGTISLTADFSENTLYGCLGCVGDLELERSHLYLVVGRRQPEPLLLPTDFELHFGMSDIDEDGTFESAEVTIQHPERTITRSGGTWSGTFSNIPDADGNPRLISGLARAGFAEADGSRGGFQGLFTALSETLRATDTDEDP